VQKAQPIPGESEGGRRASKVRAAGASNEEEPWPNLKLKCDDGKWMLAGDESKMKHHGRRG